MNAVESPGAQARQNAAEATEATGPSDGGFRGMIVALGGGGFSMSETGESAIDDWLLDRAKRLRDARTKARQTGQAHQTEQSRQTQLPRQTGLPCVCFVPTASGDSRDYIERFEAAFAGRAETRVLSLFGHSPWGYADPAMLLEADLIYVGGGSTANLLTLWRRHGVDRVMRQAGADGTILAGISAGANCWFTASSTDSFGPLSPLGDGLGFLPGSACPHYHGEEGRAESFRRWIDSGDLPAPGIAIDDGAAVIVENGALTSVIAEEPGARAYLVEAETETPLATVVLGDPAQAREPGNRL